MNVITSSLAMSALAPIPTSPASIFIYVILVGSLGLIVWSNRSR